MSLLNKVLGVYNPNRMAFSQQEAIAAIAISAIASDGYLLDQETERLIVLLTQMEMFKGYSEKQITNMLDRLLNLLSEKGISNLVAIANDVLHPEYKEIAFTLAVDLILIDGVFSGKEQTFLTRLFQVLEVPVEKASAIFQAQSANHQETKKKSRKYRNNQNYEK
ncbi:tellurite resistance TerB family protein [Okeania sp. SIO2G5]|uniref:tellurite resistance TerB family protein n=2 Tax=Okeania TaxID=1458928 RepID=UPI0013B6539A|nr:tellurite resistance TerB family protein [Okeania sp. SIO2G5]NEP74348.1 tellurite resistance TerB family protein [Okeania sp. SIO2G5]NEP95313.1 tellurite resistance TerB family protein [Okeania sp. SIO2F5]